MGSTLGATVCALAIVSLWATGAAAPAKAAETCELHIFPAYAVGVVDATQTGIDQGLVGNAVVNLFRVKDPRAVEVFLKDALPPEDQMAMLKAVDFSATLKGKGKAIILHDTPVTSLTFKGFKTQPRTAQTNATCYAELVLGGTYFEKNTMSQKLKSSYFWRDFGTATVPKRAVFKAVGEGISNFPPKTEQEAKAAREIVRGIAQRNLVAILNAK